MLQITMRVAKETVVAIEYTLKDDQGNIIDASDGRGPLEYLQGYQNIIPGLERELEGLKAGDQKTVVVKPEEGYGVREESRIHQVPKNKFPPGSYAVGDHVTATAPDGGEMDARITAMDAKNYTLDFNHELAGKTLNFEITVVEVRAATRDELQHGHVHGPGGHHHH